jgi:hypothetical protein
MCAATSSQRRGVYLGSKLLCQYLHPPAHKLVGTEAAETSHNPLVPRPTRYCSASNNTHEKHIKALQTYMLQQTAHEQYTNASAAWKLDATPEVMCHSCTPDGCLSTLSRKSLITMKQAIKGTEILKPPHYSASCTHPHLVSSAVSFLPNNEQCW